MPHRPGGGPPVMTFQYRLHPPTPLSSHPADFARAACDEIVMRSLQRPAGRIISLQQAADSLTEQWSGPVLEWVREAVQHPYLDSQHPRYLFDTGARLALADSVSAALQQHRQGDVLPSPLPPVGDSNPLNHDNPVTDSINAVEASTAVEADSSLAFAESANRLLQALDIPLELSEGFWTALIGAQTLPQVKQRRRAVGALLDSPEGSRLRDALLSCDASQLKKTLQATGAEKGEGHSQAADAVWRVFDRLKNRESPLSRTSSPDKESEVPTADPDVPADAQNVPGAAPGPNTIQGEDEEPAHLLSSFEQQLTGLGNETARIRELMQKLRNVPTRDVAMLACHQNLRDHTLVINKTPVSARQRSMLLLTRAFQRMCEAGGPHEQLTLADLMGGDHWASNTETARTQAMQASLTCGLMARTTRLHQLRIGRGQPSEWNTRSNGLYLFNMLQHLGSISPANDIGRSIQDLYTELVIACGRQLPFNSSLSDVWRGSDRLQAHIEQRVRRWLVEMEDGPLSKTGIVPLLQVLDSLDFARRHAQAMLSDPLRTCLASRILLHMATGLHTRLTERLLPPPPGLITQETPALPYNGKFAYLIIPPSSDAQPCPNP